MLNRFVADYLDGLAAADFAPTPRVAGRLASYDGLLMEATGLSLPVGTVCRVGGHGDSSVLCSRLAPPPRPGPRVLSTVDDAQPGASPPVSCATARDWQSSTTPPHCVLVGSVLDTPPPRRYAPVARCP